MVDYAKLSDTALSLIDDNGRDLVLRNTSGGVYDTLTNSITGATVVDENVRGVMSGYSKMQVDNKNIKVGDKLFILPARGISGEVNQDTVIIDGSDEWYAIKVDEIRPGDVVIMYKVQVRK